MRTNYFTGRSGPDFSEQQVLRQLCASGNAVYYKTAVSDARETSAPTASVSWVNTFETAKTTPSVLGAISSQQRSLSSWCGSRFCPCSPHVASEGSQKELQQAVIPRIVAQKATPSVAVGLVTTHPLQAGNRAQLSEKLLFVEQRCKDCTLVSGHRDWSLAHSPSVKNRDSFEGHRDTGG